MAEVQKSFKNWLICDNCGELQVSVPLHNRVNHQDHKDEDLRCNNCEARVYQHSKRWLEISGALAITAFVLFFLAVFCPIITLELGPKEQSVTIFEGFLALVNRDSWFLAGLILSTLVLIPCFEIFALLYLLVPYSLNKKVPARPIFLRWLSLAQDWSMLEVFLVSLIICSVKMADMAKLSFEMGAYILFILVSVLSLTFTKIDRKKLWSAVNPNNYFIKDVHEPVCDCRICGAMVGHSISESDGRCPRCKSKIARRIPNSLQKTSAFLIAAIILYIPANMLPIMSYTSLGINKADTIFSGVVALTSSGLYTIALVVFVASIAVPIAKIVILSYLIWSVKAGHVSATSKRTKLYKFVEVIGRWSMIDVFVVTILVAIVQFGFFYSVEPEPALIAFAAVVILTMLAAESFDSRLLWDAKMNQKRRSKNIEI